jgi:hypothetical protein
MQGSFPQAGFFYQNHIAALKLLELLEFGSRMQTITLENYKKGPHIDDIIVEYDFGTRYYQIKWSSNDKTPYTIHYLITAPDDESRSLVEDLARGYLSLADRDRVEIILFSTKNASNQKFPKRGITSGLADFIEHIHLPFLEDHAVDTLSDLPNYQEYEAVITKIQSASGLDPGTFNHFLKRVRFMLRQGDKEEQQRNIAHKMATLGIEENLYETLLVAAVEWSISGTTIRAGDVLKRLGLAGRFLDRITHDFKVEQEYFVGNPGLFAQLDDAIESLDGGFILLEGPPGSGKSTYLTEYTKQRANVRFAYYCFVPDENMLGNPRLEKDTFLKSLCLGIKNSFPDIDFPEPYSDDYESKLQRWLDRLSQLGSKLIFVIDGLDHVDKKKDKLQQPLTHYLEGNLPAKIFFLLSSQYPEALADGIQTQVLQDERRHIKVCKLSEGGTQEFLERRGVHPSLKVVSMAADKSEGIPLYLHYIAMLLIEVPSNEYQQEKILQDLPYLENSKIDTYHEFLYQQAAKDALAVRVLALLAVRREFTSTTTLLDLLRSLSVHADVLQVESVCAKYQHLLRRTDAKGYTIFHNSFREFVLRRSEVLIEPINDALVTYYKGNPNNDETYRNFYRHLFELGRYEEILGDCDEQWLERSWQAFRPFEEISSNLNLAWDAATRVLSLKEFVRIAFLEQRFGRASFNFEWTDSFKPATFLLNINKQEEAVRRVWDGERIRIYAGDFYEFVLDYFKKTGHPLPRRIADVGFAQFQRRTNRAETTARFEARALYEDWRYLFAEVHSYEWRASDEHTHGVTVASAGENEATNNSIKRSIVDVIFLVKKVYNLIAIAQEPNLHPSVRTHAALRASESLLIANEVDEAVRLAGFIDFKLIQRAEYNHLIARFAEANSYDSIASLVPTRYSPPLLFEGLTRKDRDFGLKDELLQLYENLRVCFLEKSADYRVYQLKADSFNLPERGVFTALIGLAELWSESVQMNVDANEKVERVRTILNALNMNYDLRTRDFEGSDLYTDQFIGREMHKVYADIWSFVSQLSPAHIAELVSHWLLLDEGKNGYKNQRVSIDFAKSLNDRQGAFEAEVLSLLKRAERQARDDEETLTLLTNLVDCAEAYGYCGLDAEAERLWTELYTLACGVYSRKDYQFNEAVGALVSAHKSHPEKSIGRLSTLLTLAHQLWGAADDRAVARAIGALIDFACDISPALALELLKTEEKSIFRGEVIEALSDTLASNADADLRYVWAIVRTMNKWDNFQSYNDTTYPTLLSLFEACLEKGDMILAQEIYEYARHQLLVEKEMPGRLCEFAKKAISKGATVSTVEADRKAYEDEWEKDAEAKAQGGGSLPKATPQRPLESPSFDELHTLAEQDFREFQEQLAEMSNRNAYLERIKDLKHAYTTLKETLSSLLILRAPLPQGVVRQNRFANMRFFVEFKRAVLEARTDNEVGFTETLEVLFENLLAAICAPIFGNGWREVVESHFNYLEWVRKFASSTYRRNHGLNREVLRDNLIPLIEQSAISNLTNWEQFCREHLSPYELTSALLTISVRLKHIDEKRSIQLLHEAWSRNKDFFYTHGSESTNSFLNLLFELDAERAKKTLLEGFSYQYKQFPKDIIYHMDQVLAYADSFGEDEIHEFAYGQYERYNTGLAEGLAKKETDFDWIQHYKLDDPFESAVIQYLLHLFDYPQVEIRELSLASLFDLVKSDPKALEAAFSLCEGATDNTKEHLLALVHSVALYDYQLVLAHKQDLLAFLELPHFNIRQTTKEILLYCVTQGGELESGELRKVELVNVKPQLLLTAVEEGALQEGRRFMPCSYQTTLLHQLYTDHPDGSITAKVYTRLLNRGWTSQSWMAQEQAVHRAHNINTNYDNIEINGPYFAAVQEVLNETFLKEISARKYEDADIDRLKYEFRLYDPSDLLCQSGQPSENVDWCGPGLSEDEFLGFNDIKQHFFDLPERDREWITVYEDGHQRTGDGDRKGRTTYFTIASFLAKKALLPDLDELLTDQLPLPYYSTKNLFRHEIPGALPNGDSYPVTGIKPIIGISKNRFRGQRELSIATLLPDVLNDLNLSRACQHSLDFHRNGEPMIQFLMWQKAYDQDRRRQKPKSAGVSLMIRKSLLDQYTQDDYRLCFEVRLRRTTDRYVPEKDMNWRPFRRVFY